MSNWGIRWNPWNSNYSSLECDQMRFVQKSYCESMECGEEDLPSQLRMDDSFSTALYQPTVSDFDEHSFMRKMQNVVGLLRNPAEGIISSICAYQKSRYERVTFRGYLNDPRTLLLEELKDWAMRTLAPASCTTEETLIDVRRRHNYLLRLQHGQQGLFQPGANNERTLLATLKDVRRVIEHRVLPTIEAERAHSSAREQLHTLEARGMDGLVHGVQFLFYVLRNTPDVPSDCTIGNLQSQHHAGMKTAMESKSGQLLELLINTPSFRTLFPEHASTSDSDYAIITESSSEGALFLDKKSNAVIPSAISGAGDGYVVSPAEFLKRNSGIVPLPEESAEKTYIMFTRLHGMLKLLADLLVSCRKARQLAGPGGDLLVYGPGGEEVRRLMQSCEAVQNEIVRLVGELTRVGVKQLDLLKRNQELGWRRSFSKVLPLENYIIRDFQACLEPIQRIHANADPIHVQRLYRKFRQATGMWVQENFTICREVSQAMGLLTTERLPPKNSCLISSGAGDEITQEPISALLPAPDVQVQLKPTSPKNESVGDQLALTTVDTPSTLARSKSTPSTTVVASGYIGLKSAVDLVSWVEKKVEDAAWRGVDMLGMSGLSLIETSNSPHKEEATAPSTEVAVADGINACSGSMLDALLLVRQAIQRIAQLAWAIRSVFRSATFDPSEGDMFVLLCGIYESVEVETAGLLFYNTDNHGVTLTHLFIKHTGVLIRCIWMLQRRIIDGERGLWSTLAVFHQLQTILKNFASSLAEVQSSHEAIVADCRRMKDGILSRPDIVPRGEGAAVLAFTAISSLADTFAGSSSVSAALLSHGEYMKQLCSQVDLHQNSMRHLQSSLSGAEEAVQATITSLEDCTSYPPMNNQHFHEQIDYIFGFNYNLFFQQATMDLQNIVVELERM